MKLNKKDLLSLLLITSMITVLVFVVYSNGYLFGSTLDFDKQHFLFPEYLREQFYDTKDFFPDFMLNLGAGQNIYNISYYGLFNPLYYLSYFFPNLQMLDFIQILMIGLVYISTLLIYFYLRKNKYSPLISFLSSFIFLTAAPVIFHAHRHIMFVNYLPFLILGFYGVDSYIDKKKPLLLMVSTVLMIYTSYFFSIGGIIVLFLYCLYRYYQKKQDLTWKKLITKACKVTIPFLISILISSLIIIPTLYVLLNNRGSANVEVDLLTLLMPDNFILEGTYNMGLTMISVILVIYLLIKGKLEEKILSIIILLVAYIPVFNYVLNGFMYINGKSLIPFIPLVVIIVARSLKYLFETNYKILKIIVVPIIILSSLQIVINVNLNDDYIDKNEYQTQTNTYNKVIDYIKGIDNGFYKINFDNSDLSTTNYLGSIDVNRNTLYSSTYHGEYQTFYYETLGNNQEYRNQFIISSTSNLLSQIYLNEKYIISSHVLDERYYKLLTKIDDCYIYENLYVQSLGYATNSIINENDYQLLTDFDKTINLLNNVIHKGETNQEIIKSDVITTPLEIVETQNIEIQESTIIANENAYLKVKVNNQKDLLFISFDLTPKNYDLQIEINDTVNKLTDKNWKYYNNNQNFEYILTNTEYLDIYLTKGEYEIRDLTLKEINLSQIIKPTETLIINKEQTKGDVIEGHIKVEEPTKFVLNIPYDDNFIIKVNDEIVDYYKVNEVFIGMDLTNEENHLIIEYKAPLKDLSLVLSILGLLLTGYFIYLNKTK